MARPYSLDLRERVVAAVAAGASCRDAAKTYQIGVATVVKWSQRFRATGSAAAKPMGGVRRNSLGGQREWLLARIAAAPDVTLRGLVAELAERGVRSSYYAVWLFFVRHGISFKKKPARQRAGSARRGAAPCAVEAASRKA
jgi:transposase